MEIQAIISSGLLELYAMGLTKEEDTEQVQKWIKTYPEVLEEFKAIQLVLEEYAQANSIEPSATVKEKIVSAIQNDIDVNKTPIMPLPKAAVGDVKRIGFAWKITAAASIALLIGSAYFNFLFYNKFKQANSNLKNTETQLGYQQQSIDDMKKDMSVVQSKYSEPLSLHGMDAAPDAAAKIFWMKNTGEVYLDPSNLPDVPKGKQYQLWAMVDGKPVDAGTILTSKKGDKYRIQKMKTFGRAEAFAVTLEEEGGSKSPSMDKMYVMGKI